MLRPEKTIGFAACRRVSSSRSIGPSEPLDRSPRQYSYSGRTGCECFVNGAVRGEFFVERILGRAWSLPSSPTPAAPRVLHGLRPAHRARNRSASEPSPKRRSSCCSGGESFADGELAYGGDADGEPVHSGVVDACEGQRVAGGVRAELVDGAAEDVQIQGESGTVRRCACRGEFGAALVLAMLEHGRLPGIGRHGRDGGAHRPLTQVSSGIGPHTFTRS